MAGLLLYIGTYTREGGSGIVVLEFSGQHGQIVREVQVLQAQDPSYLARHPRGRVIYSVNEVRELDGVSTGGVSVYEVDPITGKLKCRHRHRSHGASPAHLAANAEGTWLGVANYRGASVAFARLDTDGLFSGFTPRERLMGRSAHPDRQTQPHPHQIVFHQGRAWIPDLGADRVLSIVPDSASGTLPGITIFPSGTGPRHLVFSVSGTLCFVLCELSSELAVWRTGDVTGSMELLARHSSRAPGARGNNQAGAIRLHPNGRWLFCSNRGDDTVAVFSVDEHQSRVELRQVVSCGGRWPRDLALSLDGVWLMVANQHSGNLTVFPVAPDSGRIGAASSVYDIAAPACVLLAPQ